MKKITDFSSKRSKVIKMTDANGRLYDRTEEYVVNRAVKTVTPGLRFAHFIIDGICYQIIIYLISYLFGLIILADKTVLNLTFGLIGGIATLLSYPAYYAFCEFKWQRTIGKYLTKTVVINDYAEKPDLRQIILRSLIRLVPFEPLSCLGDNSSRGWHDRWSDTWVVTETELQKLKELLNKEIENKEKTA